MSVGPFQNSSGKRGGGRGEGAGGMHSSHPLCIRACLPVLVYEVSMPLFENKYKNKSSVEIKLKPHKVALSRAKSP